MSPRVVLILAFELMLFCGVGLLSLQEARAQNPHDYALQKSIVAAQSNIAAAARYGDGDALASIYHNSMLELIAYKQKYNIPEEIPQNPCQRSYEEISASAMFLLMYIRPSGQFSGTVDRAGNGHQADKYWGSHREALAECDRLLKLPQSPLVGPDRLTSIVAH